MMRWVMKRYPGRGYISIQERLRGSDRKEWTNVSGNLTFLCAGEHDSVTDTEDNLKEL